MDIGIYKDGMELVGSSEENGILTQEFYNPGYHVKYNRIVWGGVVSKESELELIKELCSSSIKNLLKVIPNIVRLEIDDMHMESMYFEDEDTIWYSRTLLQPLLDKLNLRERLTIRNLIKDKDDYYKAIDELTSNNEYISTIKGIYKNYLNKEL